MIATSFTLTREFVLAGKAVFTLEVPASFREQKEASGVECKPHYTFLVKRSKPNAKYPNPNYFVSLLTGPNNTSDYLPIGMILNDGSVRLTRNSKFHDNTMVVMLIRRLIARVWAGEIEAVEAAGFTIHHEGRCARCGRMLTTPESTERGLGPECWEKTS